MTSRYILQDGRAIPCPDLISWAKWFENFDNRRIAATHVGDLRVSTVFLGLDNGFGSGPPILWETMVFGPTGEPLHEHTSQYSSHSEALKAHAELVAALQDLGGKAR